MNILSINYGLHDASACILKNGYVYDLLHEFKKLTGHGIILNTSFNLAGDPLVETPEDAFKTLNESSIDYLWFEETKQLFYE